jgi:formyltetrahydrofolate deformylase
MADNHRVPFFPAPVEAEHKADAEAELLRLVGDLRIDLVILARYR